MRLPFHEPDQARAERRKMTQRKANDHWARTDQRSPVRLEYCAYTKLLYSVSRSSSP